MTPTDELHKMLTKAGVEYRFNDATKVFEWHFDGTDGKGSAHATEVDGGINIIACSLTPEQAIAATVGRDNSVVVHRLEQLRGGHFSWPRLYEAVTGEIHTYEMPASEAEALFIDFLIRLVCGAKVVDE